MFTASPIMASSDAALINPILGMSKLSGQLMLASPWVDSVNICNITKLSDINLAGLLMNGVPLVWSIYTLVVNPPFNWIDLTPPSVLGLT